MALNSIPLIPLLQQILQLNQLSSHDLVCYLNSNPLHNQEVLPRFSIYMFIKGLKFTNGSINNTT